MDQSTFIGLHLPQIEEFERVLEAVIAPTLLPRALRMLRVTYPEWCGQGAYENTARLPPAARWGVDIPLKVCPARSCAVTFSLNADRCVSWGVRMPEGADIPLSLSPIPNAHQWAFNILEAESCYFKTVAVMNLNDVIEELGCGRVRMSDVHFELLSDAYYAIFRQTMLLLIKSASRDRTLKLFDTRMHRIRMENPELYKELEGYGLGGNYLVGFYEPGGLRNGIADLVERGYEAIIKREYVVSLTRQNYLYGLNCLSHVPMKYFENRYVDFAGGFMDQVIYLACAVFEAPEMVSPGEYLKMVELLSFCYYTLSPSSRESWRMVLLILKNSASTVGFDRTLLEIYDDATTHGHLNLNSLLCGVHLATVSDQSFEDSMMEVCFSDLILAVMLLEGMTLPCAPIKSSTSFLAKYIREAIDSGAPVETT